MTDYMEPEASHGRLADSLANLKASGTVVLTGATGQIGSRVKRELLAAGNRVICLSATSPQLSDPDVTWIHWDYEDSLLPPILNEPVHLLIHLGAQTSAYAARRSPKSDLLHNGVRFVSLLQSLVQHGQRPFVVLAGTATQAGSFATQIGPETPDAPETFYDASKSVSELYLRQFIRETWVSGVTLKFSNVYGAIPERQGDRSLLTRMMRCALEGEPIEIYEQCDGHRDYLHIQDAVNAILSALDRHCELTRTSYWVGSGQSMRVSEAFSRIVEVAHQLTGRHSVLHRVPAPSDLYPIDRRDVHIDSSNFRADSLWRPRVSFEQGVRDLGLSLLRGRH